MSTLLKTNRRDFIKLAAAASGGLFLGFNWHEAGATPVKIMGSPRRRLRRLKPSISTATCRSPPTA